MKLAMTGCLGRMGQILARRVAASEEAALIAAVSRPDRGEELRRFLALLDVQPMPLATGSIEEALRGADGVIDFTRPAYALEVAAAAAKLGKIHVCGATGFSAEEMRKLKSYAEKTPIVHAANMSVGVNLLLEMVERAAALLGEAYDIEIVEMHHRNKADAPSGTALALGEAAAKGRGVALAEMATRGRDGMTGAREPGTIGFSALRGGDVVGDHTVVFAGPGERLELTHKASNRDIFADGALRAALWARGKKPGLYGMRDVLA